MTTTKSYLAGLGMTGIVIGSVLVLLTVGTGLVAFDGARDVGGERAPLGRVVVGKGAHSAGAERARKRPAVAPAPASAARLPVASPPVAAKDLLREARDPGRRGGHGDGGVEARTRSSLGGGAPVRDASEVGGGAAADGPPGKAKRGAGPPPGHAGNRAPSEDPAPSEVPGEGHGRSLGIGHVEAPVGKTRVGKAVDRGGPPGLLP